MNNYASTDVSSNNSTTTSARLMLYLREMFPLHLYIPFAVFNFFGLYFAVQAVAGGTTLVIGSAALIGFITMFSFSLLMRIFDEFKDIDIDKVLFPHRAVARGAVLPADLKKLGWSLVVAMIALNLYLGWALIPCLVALLFAYLTLKWFFLKDLLSNNLLLAFVTHQPLGILVNTYAAVVALTAVSSSVMNVWIAIAILAYFFPISAWETSRKIRAPDQETDYITYSKLLGPRWATCLPLLFVVLSGTFYLMLMNRLEFPPWSVGAVVLIIAAYVILCLKFMIKLDADSNILRPATETAVSLVQILFLALLLFRFGLSIQ